MNEYKFFEHLSDVFKFKLINKFYNIISTKNTKKSHKFNKYYKLIIKQYRYLGILPVKTIKFVKIK